MNKIKNNKTKTVQNKISTESSHRSDFLFKNRCLFVIRFIIISLLLE
ncbi:unnamed protein product [Amoebophrya sp. A120]|nr:unnamed protein product [Amoebophrya sp. A120]|eukprot:GSA120T00009873001.1